MQEFLKSPHFRRIADELMQKVEKKEEMEQNFSLDVADEYSIIKQRIIELVAELLKAGIPHHVEDELFFMEIEDRKIDVSLGRLRDFLGEEEFSFFFPEVKAEPTQESDQVSSLVLLMSSLQKEKEALTAENNRLRKMNRELERSKSSDQASLRQRVEQLESEKKKLLSEVAELLASPKNSDKEETLSTENAILAERLSSQESENQRLYRLAYYDAKTDTMNANAFNRDFHDIDLKTTLFAMVSICKMRLINETFGRQNGDHAISRVAEELLSLFPSGGVYRIMGDKFNILLHNASYNDAYSLLANLKQQLEKEKIEIVFGLSLGVQCPDKGSLIKAAETLLLQMKNSASSVSSVQWEKEEPLPKEETIQGSIELSAEELMAQYLEENE